MIIIACMLFMFFFDCAAVNVWNKKQSCSFFDKHHFYLHLSRYKVLQILRVLGEYCDGVLLRNGSCV